MATKDDKSRKKQSSLSPESQQKTRDNDNMVKPDKALRDREESTEKILEAFGKLSSQLDGLAEKLENHKNELGRCSDTLTRIMDRATKPTKPDPNSEVPAANQKEKDFQLVRSIYHNLDQRLTSSRPGIDLNIAVASLYPRIGTPQEEKQIEHSAN